MYPYLNLGPVHLGTFGLLLWLAAVAGTIVLHKNFIRNGVDADALNVVALVVVAGRDRRQGLARAAGRARTAACRSHIIGRPGWHHPLDVTLAFLSWFRDGFAWFGGMVAGIAVLMIAGTLRPLQRARLEVHRRSRRRCRARAWARSACSTWPRRRLPWAMAWAASAACWRATATTASTPRCPGACT